MIRLLIVDDSELDRDGLKVSLMDETEIEIVGEAANGIDAVDMAKQLRPDVILMDLRLPYKNGVEAIAEICATEAPPYVICITTYDTDRDVGDALKAGAKTHVRKDAPMSEMMRAIRTGGGVPASTVPTIRREPRSTEQSQRSEVRAGAFDGPRPGSDILTDLQLDILQFLIQGRTNSQIAQHFALPDQEIRDNALVIYRTLNVKDRSGLYSAARRKGIVS